jgi:glycosyltransferase involved in cell wall biosynthesis
LADILHVGKYYAPHQGGIESHVKSLAKRQGSHADVSVLVANDHPYTVTERVDGVQLTRVASYGVAFSMALTPSFPLHFARQPARLTHIHVPNPTAALSDVLLRRDEPLVITHHSDILGRIVLREMVQPFIHRMMKRASVILVSSHRYLESSPQLAAYRDKCQVVPLGIEPGPFLERDEERIAAVRQRYSAERYIVAVSRLVPYKGIDMLIRAMPDVDSKLLVVGYGPQRKALQRLIDELGVQHKVAMDVRQQDLVPAVQGADVFVLPSVNRTESFGMVQVEAMVAGRPVVNTSIDSGAPEVSPNGITGLTVPPSDPKALARAIQTLLYDEELRVRFGQAGRERALREYTADQVSKRVAAVYRTLIPDIFSDGQP